MSVDSHQATLDADRVSIPHKLVYGLGAFVNNLLGAAIGTMVIVLNLGLGMNPALVGLLGALPRLTDALTDPLMGYISDKTRSKWGRRRPYIFIGALAAGLMYFLLWQLPENKSEDFYFWYFLIGSLIFYLAYTVFATPWVALGFELTPDYHERTRIMAVSNFMGQFAWLLAPWFLWFMQHESLFDNLQQGAGWLALIIGSFVMCVGVLPAILLKERFGSVAATQPPPETVADKPKGMGAFVTDFFKGFVITVKCKPFLMLCIATFMVFNGYMMVMSFQTYVIIYYVFGGDQSLGSQYAGWVGTVSAIATFCVIYLVTRISSAVGKRKAFFITTGISVFGYASKWVFYRPDMPELTLIPPVFIAFGLGGLFVLMQSMIADVCDLDELETGERREGMFGSIYWWVVKLGLAAALAAGGFLLNWTGFDVELGAAQTEQALTLMRLSDILVPLVGSLIAIWSVIKYPITEQMANDVRRQLEQRRGGAES